MTPTSHSKARTGDEMIAYAKRLEFQLERANRIIGWMVPYIGKMCPPENGLFDLNKHCFAECHMTIRQADIELPAMYRLGYKNNNCIGCVKGQSGYWNKIRRDFPETFAKMAATERQLDAAICKIEGITDGKRWRKRVFLDELPPDAGRYVSEPDIECGVLCIHEEAP